MSRHLQHLSHFFLRGFPNSGNAMCSPSAEHRRVRRRPKEEFIACGVTGREKYIRFKAEASGNVADRLSDSAAESPTFRGHGTGEACARSIHSDYERDLSAPGNMSSRTGFPRTRTSRISVGNAEIYFPSPCSTYPTPAAG